MTAGLWAGAAGALSADALPQPSHVVLLDDNSRWRVISVFRFNFVATPLSTCTSSHHPPVTHGPPSQSHRCCWHGPAGSSVPLITAAIALRPKVPSFASVRIPIPRRPALPHTPAHILRPLSLSPSHHSPPGRALFHAAHAAGNSVLVKLAAPRHHFTPSGPSSSTPWTCRSRTRTRAQPRQSNPPSSAQSSSQYRRLPSASILSAVSHSSCIFCSTETACAACLSPRCERTTRTQVSAQALQRPPLEPTTFIHHPDDLFVEHRPQKYLHILSAVSCASSPSDSSA